MIQTHFNLGKYVLFGARDENRLTLAAKSSRSGGGELAACFGMLVSGMEGVITAAVVLLLALRDALDDSDI